MNNYIDSRWYTDDVKEVRPDLTEAQCMEVLLLVEKNHDATIGINWDVLEITADHLFPIGVHHE